jgi:NADH-quinone oxidoreductase subunit N
MEGTHYYLLVPEMIACALGLFMLVIGLLTPKSENKSYGYLTLAGLVIVFCATLIFQGDSLKFFGGMYIVDPFATFFKQLVLIAAFLVTLTSIEYVNNLGYNQSEYYSMIIFITLGMMIMVSAGDLITFYVGLELMTLTFVVLTAFKKNVCSSAEAGLKYLVLGAMSSAVLLYGLSLIYGTTGTTIITGIFEAISLTGITPLLLLGMIFALSGFAFKISAVPFHMWSPDIYEGAPTPVTAFLAVASKAASFAVMIRIFVVALPQLADFWLIIVTALAVLTIIFGNVVAIPQTNIKRMLAYSSIAHAGYILLGLVAFTELGISAMLFYALIYIFANVGAFGVATAFYNQTGSNLIKDYAGLASRNPFLAGVMFLSLVSLAGLPPLAGFVGKLLLFTAVIDQGLIWLAFLGILMSMVSVYYYFMVIKAMYINKAQEDAKPFSVPASIKVALSICIVGSLFFGIYWSPLVDLTQYVAKALFCF